MKNILITFIAVVALNACDKSSTNGRGLSNSITGPQTQSNLSSSTASAPLTGTKILATQKEAGDQQAALTVIQIAARVLDRTDSSVTIAMSATNNNVRGYNLLLNGRLAKTVTTSQATLEGLSAETHYALSVEGLDSQGQVLGSSSLIRATTLAEEPSSSDMGYFVPERKIVGEPTILATQASFTSTGTVQVLRTGETFTDLDNPLAFAVKKAIPGDVIGISGNHSGIWFGKTGHSSAFATWDNGAVIRNLSIKSINPNQPARIQYVKILGNYREAGSHGVDDLTFQNIRFKSGSVHESTPFNIYNNSVHGTVRLYDISLENSGHSSYGGTGLKWGMRAMGNVKFYDMRGVTCPDRAEEHCLYLDGPGLDGNNADPQTAGGYFSEVVQLEPSGRTGIQIVNRESEDAATPAGGQLVIRNSQLLTRAGSGGSAVTVAGFLGAVYLENLDIDTDLGAIVVYSEQNHGLLYNENGFTTDFVKMKNINVTAPQAQRSHIAISGVEEVEVMAPFNVTGSSKAFNFNTQYGGGINNGSVKFLEFPSLLSDYSGFNSQTKIMDSGSVLSDPEINALQH